MISSLKGELEKAADGVDGLGMGPPIEIGVAEGVLAARAAVAIGIGLGELDAICCGG